MEILIADEVLPTPFDARDWKASAIYPGDQQVPAVFSHMSKLRPVRNQRQQAACTGFAAACMKEVHENIENELSENLSPQYVYDMRENPNLAGMHLRDAMKILHKRGIPTEHTYPYRPNPFDEPQLDDEPRAVKAEAANHRIKGYAQVETIMDAKRALYKNGPLIISFPINNHDIPQFWLHTYTDTRYAGSHAVTVVGYDAEGFMLRNSWGIQWGDKGYVKYPYEQWGMHWEVWTAVDAASRELTDITYGSSAEDEEKDEENGCLANLCLRFYRK